VHQAVRQWLRPGLAALIILTVAANSSALVVAAYAVASLLVLCSQVWSFVRGRQVLPRPTALDHGARRLLQTQMLRYAAPFAAWGAFTWLQAASDRWVLQVVRSSTDVGLYSIVAQLGAYPVILAGAMLTQVAAPIVFSEAGEASDLNRVRNAIHVCAGLAAVTLVFTIALAIVGAMFHDQIFSVLVGPQYRDVSALLPLATLSSGLFVVGQMLSLMPMALGDSRSLLAPKIWTALLAVVLYAVGAKLFGLVGVLWAGLVFACCYNVWVGLVARSLVAGRSRVLASA
jgi:O-antigen/teichoic acid export membrane protein